MTIKEQDGMLAKVRHAQVTLKLLVIISQMRAPASFGN